MRRGGERKMAVLKVVGDECEGDGDEGMEVMMEMMEEEFEDVKVSVLKMKVSGEKRGRRWRQTEEGSGEVWEMSVVEMKEING